LAGKKWPDSPRGELEGKGTVRGGKKREDYGWRGIVKR
jgi:hypothetical protein